MGYFATGRIGYSDIIDLLISTVKLKYCSKNIVVCIQSLYIHMIYINNNQLIVGPYGS